ncbi:MAG: alpha/beta fold hydrolase, partial [Candidatus Sericytochromatia bacterium]|nr:alpha/beta fold hydrolase [Candidatus Sericytochromatia bacterium]
MGTVRKRLLAPVIAGILGVAWIGPAAFASYTVLHPERLRMDAAGMGEPVQIPGADGVSLAGRWHPVAKPLGTVILLHGYGQDKTQMMPAAHFLRQARFNTLAYDARAHGDSAGTMTTVGSIETQDLSKVLDWLTVKGVHTNVGALGYSMGAATAIYCAARDPRLSAVAIEGCFSTLDRLLGVAFPVFFHLPSFPYGPLSVRLTEWQAGISVARQRPV